MILILDLDGVLITTPAWRQDEMDLDGYSKFCSKNVDCLNQLLKLETFEIWLSSTRRVNKSLEEFNAIFENRNINTGIKGFLPISEALISRKEEVENFIAGLNNIEYLIIDDDKSLNGLHEKIKDRLVLTDYSKGFDVEKLEEAKIKLKSNEK